MAFKCEYKVIKTTIIMETSSLVSESTTNVLSPTYYTSHAKESILFHSSYYIQNWIQNLLILSEI